jgi:hypothetical protein
MIPGIWHSRKGKMIEIVKQLVIDKAGRVEGANKQSTVNTQQQWLFYEILHWYPHAPIYLLKLIEEVS